MESHKSRILDMLQSMRARPQMYFTNNGEVDSALWAFLHVLGRSYGPNTYSKGAMLELRSNAVRAALTPTWIERAIDETIKALQDD